MEIDKGVQSQCAEGEGQVEWLLSPNTSKYESGFGTVEDGSWKDLEDSISKNLKGLKEAVSRSLVSLEKASYQD